MRKFDTAEQRVLATWSLDCAERVLPLFERARPHDPRPRDALAVGRRWVETGEFSMSAIRSASLGAHAAARDVASLDAACAAARAAGQAVATAHVAQHAYGGALYALRAIAADGERGDAMERVATERSWQERHLPEPLRSEIVRRIRVEERRSGRWVALDKGPGF